MCAQEGTETDKPCVRTGRSAGSKLKESVYENDIVCIVSIVTRISEADEPNLRVAVRLLKISSLQ